MGTRLSRTANSAAEASVTTHSLKSVVEDAFFQKTAGNSIVCTDAVETHCTIRVLRTAVMGDTQDLKAVATTGIRRDHRTVTGHAGSFSRR